MKLDGNKGSSDLQGKHRNEREDLRLLCSSHWDVPPRRCTIPCSLGRDCAANGL